MPWGEEQERLREQARTTRVQDQAASDCFHPGNQFRGVCAVATKHHPLPKFPIKCWLNLFV